MIRIVKPDYDLVISDLWLLTSEGVISVVYSGFHCVSIVTGE